MPPCDLRLGSSQSIPQYLLYVGFLLGALLAVLGLSVPARRATAVSPVLALSVD